MSRLAKFGMGSVIWGDRALGDADAMSTFLTGLQEFSAAFPEGQGQIADATGQVSAGARTFEAGVEEIAQAPPPPAPPWSLSNWLSASIAPGWPSNLTVLLGAVGFTVGVSLLKRRGRR